jgi:hypothetical protein
MRKMDVERFARAVLGPRRPDARAEFAATVASAPTQADEEVQVWHESSFELRHGMDISEAPLETLPGELRELFPKA